MKEPVSAVVPTELGTENISTLLRKYALPSSIAMTAVYVGTKANAQEEIKTAGILRM